MPPSAHPASTPSEGSDDESGSRFSRSHIASLSTNGFEDAFAEVLSDIFVIRDAMDGEERSLPPDPWSLDEHSRDRYSRDRQLLGDLVGTAVKFRDVAVERARAYAD